MSKTASDSMWDDLVSDDSQNPSQLTRSTRLGRG